MARGEDEPPAPRDPERGPHVDAADLKDYAVNKARTDEEEQAASDLAERLVDEHRKGHRHKR